MSSNPYQGFGPEAYWKHAVAALSPFEMHGLWKPKFQVTKGMKIVTAGSCFAQHIGKALRARGYGWFDAEPAPPFVEPDKAKEYNYGVFSFRTQNIYTTRMLRQWLEYAFGVKPLPAELWEQDGRWYDPLRPTVEPGGFGSAEELAQAREATLAAIRRAVKEAKIFVFTMGLTEAWQNRETGLEYATCPGTAAGRYDETRHVFVNHRFESIQKDLAASLKLLRTHNGRLRVLLTVSPVPLTATASGQHVVTATTYSKSVLRAVAGQAAQDYAFVDYFPSYEIVTAPPYRGAFFQANQRTMAQHGVDFVMGNFFADQIAAFGEGAVAEPAKPARRAARPAAANPAEPGAPEPTAPETGGKRARRGAAKGMGVVCEEEMLNAFS